MSKPRGQKAPRRLNISGYQLPATSLLAAGWLAICHKGSLMTRLLTALLAGGILAGSIFPAELRAEFPETCPDAISATAARAEQILDRQSDRLSGPDRAALVCLARAVRRLDEKLRGLSSGTPAFDGQTHIPNSYDMTKPPASEGE